MNNIHILINILMSSINIKPNNNENEIKYQNNFEEQENEIILKEF